MDGICLPEDSIFDKEDYKRMAEVASTELANDILVVLEKADRLSQNELVETLECDADDIPGTLKQLQRVALVTHRHDPTANTKDTYSYYRLTELSRVILEKGVAEGVRTLAQCEHEAEEKYNK